MQGEVRTTMCLPCLPNGKGTVSAAELGSRRTATMRLTAETIQEAPAFINAVLERELNLRGGRLS